MRRFTSVVALVLLAAGARPTTAQTPLQAQLVAAGLSAPLAFVQVPGQPAVQLVVEQGGHIRVLQNGTLQQADFLDLSALTVAAGEQGLLGLALAPDYATSGRLWVNFTDRVGNTVVARFKRSGSDPLAADPATRFDLVWPDGLPYITQPFANHNGGNLAFGPDGFLYIGMGDGGSGNDPGNRAQDPQTLLGKMLRIDVNVDDADPRGYRVPPGNPFVGQAGTLGEIWAFGLRNPWRWSFDDPSLGGTGALVIGDVGQSAWEEVDYEPAGRGGRNYGWRIREGAHDNVTTLPPAFLPLTDPIFEYSHAVGIAIVGGFVYRGTALDAAYRGRYFFGDLSGRIWSLGLVIDAQTGEATAGDLREHTADLGAAASSPSSFGVDAAGEIYVVNYQAGTVFRIGSAPTTCATPDPFVALGGGTCVNGGWLPPGMTSNPPAPSPGGCATPDPFVALGGGTCVNGGWLPPGIAPGSSPPPAPTPGGCATPDPFVALGGGTCVNGGWLPPGIAPGSSPPAPPPAPTPGGCATPDPFVALGGGTCVNGGWLPPGIAPGSSPPAPPPAPTPGGCATPDPFVALGGGTCVNGGWLPPGIAPAQSAPPAQTGGCPGSDPFVSIAGLVGLCVNGGWLPVPGVSGTATVHFAAGVWIITADGGGTFVPTGGLPPAFMVDGLRASFSARLRPDLPASPNGQPVDLLSIVRLPGPDPVAPE